MSQPTPGADTLTAAYHWYTAGASVVRAAADGTKRPLGEWKQYQHNRPPAAEVQAWFANQHPGIGIVCGAASGNIEMLEFEGRAVDEEIVGQFQELAENSGLGDIWQRLMSGYVEETPSGGLHFIYRVTGGPVLGNTKLARRPATETELAAVPADKIKVLIETRGEGGFVVIAPSHGPVHPTGRPWVACVGNAATIPTLTTEERDAMFTVARALDQMPQPQPRQPSPPPASPLFAQPARGGTETATGADGDGVKPGDDYEARTPWADILTGWTEVYQTGTTTYWRRPGKAVGISATTGHNDDRDRLYVFSSSTEFEDETPYTKFGAYTLLNHGGDYRAAAAELGRLGYGVPPTPSPVAATPKMETSTGDDDEEPLTRIVSKKGSAFTIRRTRWLWRDRIPLGGLALVAGKGDVSKSTLFAQFVAWITTGDMKGEFYGTPRDVAYVVNEDSIEETVAPRMIAHGADMDKVHFLRVKRPIGEDALSLPQDEELLRKFIKETGVVVTFIDPLSANVTGRKNDQGDMRATYQVVNRLAEITRTSIAGLAHTRKAGATDVMEAIIGSSEQGNVARSVHGIVMDPEEDGARILSCEKLNVGQKSKLASLRFGVKTALVPCTDGSGDQTPMPRIVWLEEATDTASDIMSDAQLGHEGVGDCARWLLTYLTNNGGEAHSSDVKEAALKANRRFSDSMLKRARKTAGVQSHRTRETPSRTVWTHPSNAEGDQGEGPEGGPLSYTHSGDPSDISAGHTVGSSRVIEGQEGIFGEDQ